MTSKTLTTGLFLLATAVLSAQMQHSQAGTDAPEHGSLRDNVYSNTFFGFSFEIPKDWVGVNEPSSAAESRPFVPHHVLLIAAPSSSGPSSARLTLQTTDLSKPMLVSKTELSVGAQDEKQFGNVIARSLLNDPSTPFAPIDVSGTNFSISGHNFNRREYQRVVRAKEHKSFRSVTVTVLKGYAVYWMVEADSQKETTRLAKGLQQSIHFD